MVVDEIIAFHYAHAYLGSKLHIGPGLAAYNRADMRLEDADNAVRAGGGCLCGASHPAGVSV